VRGTDGRDRARPARSAERVIVTTPARVIFVIPFWIAERNGYFKDENIDATLSIGGRTGELTDQLRNGTAHIHIGGPDGVLIDATKSGPLRILAGVVRRPPLWLIAKPSIKSFADLRGANIGVLSLTEGSSKLLLKMARAAGINPNDFKLTPVGGAPDRHVLLKQGKIDAGMQPLPLNYEAEADGFNSLAWAGSYEPDWQFITVNANDAWARQKPRVATGFLRALLRGQQFIQSHPAEAAQIAAEVLNSPAPLAARALKEALRLGILDPNLDWSEPGLRRIYENMQADGTIAPDRAFDLKQIANASYLRAAQRTLAAVGKRNRN
jgi:ABC-type nitrate/sulfonate/bicarbonate transport system substrate-binding protein